MHKLSATAFIKQNDDSTNTNLSATVHLLFCYLTFITINPR